MADQKKDVQKGELSPFISDRRTINAALEATRLVLGNKGRSGSGQINLKGIDPTTTVYVLNLTEGDLEWGAVLAISDTLVDLTVEGDVPEAQVRPVFAGDTPAASSDTFVITLEPIADGQIGRAAILGVAICDIDMVDEDDEFAGPEAANLDMLVSAASGPARIIGVESGTGTKRARVLLTGKHDLCGWVELSGNYTATSSYADTGLQLTLPAAGDYEIFGSIHTQVEVTTGPGNFSRVDMRLNGAAASAIFAGAQAQVVNMIVNASTAISWFLSGQTAGQVVTLQAIAHSGPTYNTRRVLGTASGGATGIGYRRVG